MNSTGMSGSVIVLTVGAKEKKEEQKKMDAEKYWKPSQVAELLQLSESSVYRLLKKKNGLPAHKIGGAWRFIKKEVVQWVAER